jgi:ADP-heptose:LPS heptosyltransferase
MALASKLGRPTRYLSYSKYDDTLDRDMPLARPLIAEMCSLAGLQGDISLRPYLALSEKEIATAAAFKGSLLVQSSGLAAAVPMLNKQWPAERAQGVVERLGGDIRIVQIGSIQDPPLKGAFDLRGKTSLRETAAILHQARLFFGIAGFPMHLARAVDCPAVIVYGGREPADLTGYSCNINLSSTPACAPCWQRNRCDHDHVCLENISVDDSVRAIRHALSLPRENPPAVSHYQL